MREPLNRKYIIIALNEGAAWVDRHCPHLHLLHVLFISFPDKRNSRKPISGNNELIFPHRGIDNDLGRTIFHFAGIRIRGFLPVLPSVRFTGYVGEY
jgi:hypothetical protein